MRIAVLLGGPSSEREISLRSGRAVAAALVWRGHEVTQVDPAVDMETQVFWPEIDLAFIALHGRYGEDGEVQRLMASLHVPYTGSPPDACALAMDKVASKVVFKRHGIATPGFMVVMASDIQPSVSATVDELLGYPVIVKPPSEGSSIDVAIVRRPGDLLPALERAAASEGRAMIETYIAGAEITVGVIDSDPLPVVEIVPHAEFYDYEAKYTPGMTDLICPARLSPGLTNSAQRLAVLANDALGCRGASRVDMMVDSHGGLYVLEVNTVPGMTSTSDLPLAASAAGMDFAMLCERMVESALRVHGVGEPAGELV